MVPNKLSLTSKKLDFCNHKLSTTMNTFDRPEWEIPLLELLAQKHKELHDDWEEFHTQFEAWRKLTPPDSTSMPKHGKFFKLDEKKPTKEGWSLTPWTEVFKQAMEDIALNRNLMCRPSNNDRSGEFLWDVTWFNPSSDQPWMPYMVCEIEWKDNDAVLYDFKKLLATCSPFAIIVFGSDKKEKTKVDFEDKIDSVLKHVSLPENRRFIFIYASSFGAVAKGEPRIYVQSWVGSEIVEKSKSFE
jgi:hypothetical protein